MNYSEKIGYSWIPKGLEKIGLLGFVILVIFNKSVFKIRFLEWSIGAICFAAILAFIVVRGKIKKKQLLVISLPLMWTIYSLMTFFAAYNSDHHLSNLIVVVILNLISVSAVMCTFTRKESRNRIILHTAILWVSINFVIWLLWVIGIYEFENTDFSGLFRNRNTFAMQTIFLVSLVMFFANSRRYLSFSLIAISLLMVASSLSVKGFVFSFFVIFYPKYLKSSFKKKVVIVVTGLTFFACAYAAFPKMQDRMIRFAMVFTDSSSLRQKESAFLRAWLMEEGVELIIKNPVFGVGVDNARFLLIPPYLQGVSDEGLVSHNNYIEVALNSGLPGLFLFYLPLLYIFFNTKKSHPYWVEIKTLTLLYILAGIASVQYNEFMSIMKYYIIVFLYFYPLNNISNRYGRYYMLNTAKIL
ncbi:MAG: O-antigen ligase family protein [bacterium]